MGKLTKACSSVEEGRFSARGGSSIEKEFLRSLLETQKPGRGLPGFDSQGAGSAAGLLAEFVIRGLKVLFLGVLLGAEHAALRLSKQGRARAIIGVILNVEPD